MCYWCTHPERMGCDVVEGPFNFVVARISCPERTAARQGDAVRTSLSLPVPLALSLCAPLSLSGANVIRTQDGSPASAPSSSRQHCSCTTTGLSTTAPSRTSSTSIRQRWRLWPCSTPRWRVSASWYHHHTVPTRSIRPLHPRCQCTGRPPSSMRSRPRPAAPAPSLHQQLHQPLPCRTQAPSRAHGWGMNSAPVLQEVFSYPPPPFISAPNPPFFTFIPPPPNQPPPVSVEEANDDLMLLLIALGAFLVLVAAGGLTFRYCLKVRRC